jgi:hypothetical protein
MNPKHCQNSNIFSRATLNFTSARFKYRFVLFCQKKIGVGVALEMLGILAENA